MVSDLRNVTPLDEILRSVVQPFGLSARASFYDGWRAGQLYTGGWTFRVRGDLPGHFDYEYAIVAADERKMKPYTAPNGLALEFANLLTPQKTEVITVSSTLRKAAAKIREQGGKRSDWDYEAVRPPIVRDFLKKHGPLTDSFLRDGKDPRSERKQNSYRDPRAGEWAYEFTRPVDAVQQSFDLSKTDIDEAVRLAWLLLDKVPQFTLLKVIALQAFSLLYQGRDMTRCANPSCRRYFVHRREDAAGCSASCNNTLRQRRWRSKQRQSEGGQDGETINRKRRR
ncbi:MAG: hypothetical protein ACXVRK_14890 [Gaiellaceae bacterium]